jgi:hypothetical protein
MKGREIRVAVDETSRLGPLQSPAISPPELAVEHVSRHGAQALGAGGRSARSRVDHGTDPLPSDVIRLLRDENPKRVGSKSYLRFNCYRDGMTVAQYLGAVRSALSDVEAKKCLLDLQWDSDPKRDSIRIERNGMPIALRRTDSMSYGRTRRAPPLVGRSAGRDEE